MSPSEAKALLLGESLKPKETVTEKIVEKIKIINFAEEEKRQLEEQNKLQQKILKDEFESKASVRRQLATKKAMASW